MQTFTAPRAFVDHPGYRTDRERTLAALAGADIDAPIADIIEGFAAIPHCFTLQCCCGHFMCSPAEDARTLAPVPDGYRGLVRYRLAYVGFCLENSARGRALRDALAQIPAADPDYIQFGSADWFWDRWRNSYAVQVEPAAHRFKDEAVLEAAEARRTAQARGTCFARLRSLLAAERVRARV